MTTRLSIERSLEVGHFCTCIYKIQLLLVWCDGSWYCQFMSLLYAVPTVSCRKYQCTFLLPVRKSLPFCFFYIHWNWRHVNSVHDVTFVNIHDAFHVDHICEMSYDVLPCSRSHTNYCCIWGRQPVWYLKCVCRYTCFAFSVLCVYICYNFQQKLTGKNNSLLKVINSDPVSPSSSRSKGGQFLSARGIDFSDSPRLLGPTNVYASWKWRVKKGLLQIDFMTNLQHVA